MYCIAPLTKYELEDLKSTQGGLEWAMVRTNILNARSGFLPSDWSEKVVQSGLIDSKIAEWSAPSNVVLYDDWEIARSKDVAAVEDSWKLAEYEQGVAV